MNTYQKYVDYFENIAIQHVDIQHNPNPTLDNKKFFRINIEETVTGFRTSISEKSIIMILVNYSYKTVDNVAHNLMKEINFGFMILGHHEVGDFDAETTIRSKCEQIVDDIIARAKYESKSQISDINSIWYGSVDNIDNWHISPVTQNGDTNYRGVLVTGSYLRPLLCRVQDTQWGDITASDIANQNNY